MCTIDELSTVLHSLDLNLKKKNAKQENNVSVVVCKIELNTCLLAPVLFSISAHNLNWKIKKKNY